MKNEMDKKICILSKKRMLLHALAMFQCFTSVLAVSMARDCFDRDETTPCALYAAAGALLFVRMLQNAHSAGLVGDEIRDLRENQKHR